LSRNAKIVIVLLAVLAVFIGAMGYMAAKRDAAQTAEAMATVVRAERERKRGDDDTIVVLSYQAGGAATEARARVDGVRMSEYPAGRQVRICYDPNDPANIRIAEGSCG
jgi:Flp pilus assembly protein CpaB